MTEASCCCPKPMYESFFMIDRRLTTLSRPAANVRALSRMARQVIRSNKVIGKSCKSKEFIGLRSWICPTAQKFLRRVAHKLGPAIPDDAGERS